MTRQFLRNDGLVCREDDPWDVFVADEDECDPDPEPGDFWPEDDVPFTAADRLGNRLRARKREVVPCFP